MQLTFDFLFRLGLKGGFLAGELLHQQQLRCGAHTQSTPLHLQGIRHGSTEQAQADQPSLQQAEGSNAPPGFERGPGRRKKGSTSSTEAPAGRQPSADRARASSGEAPSANASAAAPAHSHPAVGKGKAGKGRGAGRKGPAADAAAASAGAEMGAGSGDATADSAAPANSHPAAGGKGKAGKGRDAARKGPAADAAAAGAGADVGAGSGGATADSAAPSGQPGRPKQLRQQARVLEVQRPAGPASAEPAGVSRTGEAAGATSKKGSRQGSQQEVVADEPPPGIPMLPNGRPASAGSPGGCCCSVEGDRGGAALDVTWGLEVLGQTSGGPNGCPVTRWVHAVCQPQKLVSLVQSQSLHPLPSCWQWGAGAFCSIQWQAVEHADAGCVCM